MMLLGVSRCILFFCLGFFWTSVLGVVVLSGVGDCLFWPAVPDM